ncbi:MAG: hypothetical protein IH939_13270 [Acidobacteria bacterium]|nr:hypothetical protein [Acidobacteriota bacterium]
MLRAPFARIGVDPRFPLAMARRDQAVGTGGVDPITCCCSTTYRASVEMAHKRLVREKAAPHRVPGAPLSAAQFSNELLADDAARDDACT